MIRRSLWKSGLRAFQTEGTAPANIPKASAGGGPWVLGRVMNVEVGKAGGNQYVSSSSF